MRDVMKLWAEMARVGVESQMVIGMRTAGMMGLMPQAAGETTRMIAEKQEALFEASLDAWRAASRGARADQVFAAALRPVSRRTGANARRLARGIAG